MPRAQLPSVRLKEPELRVVEAYAESQGLSVTDLVRRIVVREAMVSGPSTKEMGALEDAVWAVYGDQTPSWAPEVDDAASWVLLDLQPAQLAPMAEAAAKSGLKLHDWMYAALEHAAAEALAAPEHHKLFARTMLECKACKHQGPDPEFRVDGAGPAVCPKCYRLGCWPIRYQRQPTDGEAVRTAFEPEQP